MIDQPTCEHLRVQYSVDPDSLLDSVAIVAAKSLPERFGAVVRKRREANGVSQEDLAYEAGVHRTYVGMIERGQGNPSLSVISDLASALGTTITSIFRDVEAV